MDSVDVLRTERLLLRRPRADDAQAIFDRYASDPDVTRYVAWPRHQTVADTTAFLSFSDAEWRRAPAGPYLILSRADDALLGSTGFAFESADQAMTGYVLTKDAWGLGYATEALRAIVAVAPQLGVKRLTALCHTAHRASAHVLEKGGFALQGTLPRYAEFPNLSPGELSDVFLYALTFGGQ